MASIDIFAPKLLRWEGGFVNDPDDPGGATNFGVTLNTWKRVGHDKDGDGDIDAEDIRKLSLADAKGVLKKYFWDKCHADDIRSQSVAEMLVDFMYNSGGVAIYKLQKTLGIVQDGVIGPQTLRVLNSHPNQRQVFEQLKQYRLQYIDYIISRKPRLAKFSRGWKNRINSYVWVG